MNELKGFVFWVCMGWWVDRYGYVGGLVGWWMMFGRWVGGRIDHWINELMEGSYD